MEIWKDIPNYEGHFKISSLGVIKSYDRNIKHPRGGVKFQKGLIMRLNPDNNGYLLVKLVKDKIGKTFRVHRLVALTFLGESDLYVDHINHIKSDNRLENLRYVTPKGNSHSYRIFKNPEWKEKIKKEPKEKFMGLPKNITYRKDINRYSIRKQHNGSYKSFGCFKTLEDAINKLKTIQ